MDERHTIATTILVCHYDECDRTRTREALAQARVSNTLKFVQDGSQMLDYLYQRGAYAGETGAAPRPGLILIDLNMPQIEGRAALKAIQADKALNDIPIVGLSMSRLDEATMRDHKLGVDSFIAMPVTFAGLVDALIMLERHWIEIRELPPVAA